jgi:hypothetical protein
MEYWQLRVGCSSKAAMPWERVFDHFDIAAAWCGLFKKN